VNRQKTSAEMKPSHVVGIGASAGGLEALQEFFGNLSHKTGAAFIVVQHLSPDYKSMMSELLKKHTQMPIFEVEDGTTISADSIYLMPPRKNMLITEGKLLLSEQMPDGQPHMSIDVFLRSLAEDQQHKGIGVVLSGTGTDGTRGIRAMKESGGLTVVQKPDSAKFDGMPQSAFNTGLVDMVLTPEEMGESIVNYINHPSISGDAPVIHYTASDDESDSLSAIFELLNTKSSINFSQYKPSTVARRIERRLGINQLTSLESYLSLLKESNRELQILSKELLIGVTRFFRDDDAFEVMFNEVIPNIIRHTPQNESIRIWTAGCSSGEEAYSLAIMFDEVMRSKNEHRRIKIFATDVDEEAIAEASSGIYSSDIAQDISASRLETYFEPHGDGYVVNSNVRQMVIFAVHNMIEDPPFSNVDLVSCRNALIYFQQSAQKKVFTSFHFALQQGGFLFLGNSESLGEMQTHFETVDERNKIFKKLSAAKLPFSQSSLTKAEPQTGVAQPALYSPILPQVRPSRSVYVDKLKPVRERLISQYAPDCVVLDDSFEALHVYGDVALYTRGLSEGKVSTNIKDMVIDELSVAVSTALYRCEKNEEDVYYKDVAFERFGKHYSIDLAVFIVKLHDFQTSPRSFVLQFIQSTETRPLREISTEITFNVSEQSQQRINDLEQELIKKQEHLQVTVEELETTNEELQSANEELMSANEELQSTNEELQSVNEELYTVNSEYQEKIQQLTEANSDLDNVINSTDIGIVFLDQHLTIRKFTPHAANYINLRASDIGRPIHHISHELDYPDLLTQIGMVSSSGDIVEEDILSKTGQAVLLRLMPYTTPSSDESPNKGVLITITNISRLKFVENALKQAAEQFKSLLYQRAERIQHRIAKAESVSVLLVDDDSVDRTSVIRSLKSLGSRNYSVVESASVKEALEITKQMNIDVILLDYQLTGETAEDFTKELAQLNVDTPVIMLTGIDEGAMGQNFLSDEVYDVISKESLSGELIARSIDYSLERKQLRDVVTSFFDN
jgi:two-component system CheB/CheR fusion protein